MSLQVLTALANSSPRVVYKLVPPVTACARRSSIFLRRALVGCHFVDLYAGTGAVGIEAISRGAEHVWFAENAEPALASLRQNLAALKISRGFTLEDRGVGAMLQRLGKLTKPIDVVYLDPPYEAEDEYSGTLNFFGSVRGRTILAQMPWSSPNTAASRSWRSDTARSNILDF